MVKASWTLGSGISHCHSADIGDHQPVDMEVCPSKQQYYEPKTAIIHKT